MIARLDQMVMACAEWLASRFSPRGGLAHAGARLAGIRVVSPLPADRRSRPRNLRDPRDSLVAMGLFDDISGAARRVGDMASRLAEEAQAWAEGKVRHKRGIPQPATDKAKCTDPQYCWIHGHPCACCGGSDSSCPAGTAMGLTWTYCCSGRRRSFRDCCGNVSCPAGCPWCDNSSQPNWCGGAGGNKYVCTLAEDLGSC